MTKKAIKKETPKKVKAKTPVKTKKRSILKKKYAETDDDEVSVYYYVKFSHLRYSSDTPLHLVILVVSLTVSSFIAHMLSSCTELALGSTARATTCTTCVC